MTTHSRAFGAPTIGEGGLDRVPAARVALGAALLVAIIELAPAVGLQAGQLDADLGIQYFLGAETARGAVPLVDFEHTWNVGSWYFNAALQWLSGGNPSAWLYLWGRVFGPVLAAVLAVGVLYRARLRAEWVFIGVGSWLVLSHVIHSKYTIPVLWVFVLVPQRGPSSLRRDMTARALLVAFTMWSHVELAVLLGAGVMLHDLLGTDIDLRPRLHDRVARAVVVPASAAVALVLELIAYAAIGQPPGEILRQLLSNPTEIAEGFNYGYPLLSAPSLRPKLFPASLVLGFVPAVWLRLAPATRLVACLHLTQALIAVRRPDPSHVDAATTLLGLLIVLIAHDLLSRPRDTVRPGTDLPLRVTVATAGAGAAIVLAAILITFQTDSLLAAAGVTVLLPILVLLATRAPRLAPALSLGAGAVAVILLVAGVAGGVVSALRDDEALTPTEALAARLEEPLERCTGGDRVAWVVPGPLPLYNALEITNPTPFTVFWYGFQAEAGRVQEALADGTVPAIIQVGQGWPPSFGSLPDDIERLYSVCDVTQATSVTPRVTFWTAD